jgi:acyl dehydratase
MGKGETGRTVNYGRHGVEFKRLVKIGHRLFSHRMHRWESLSKCEEVQLGDSK